jgi:hypothetical protein
MAARVQRRTRWRSCGCGEAQRWWCDSDGKWRRSGSCSPCMDGKTARSLTGARGRGRRRRRAATAWLDELNGDWCSSDLHVVGNGVRRGGWRRMKQLRRRWQLFLDYGPLPGLHWRPWRRQLGWEWNAVTMALTDVRRRRLARASSTTAAQRRGDLRGWRRSDKESAPGGLIRGKMATRRRRPGEPTGVQRQPTVPLPGGPHVSADFRI